MPIIELMVNAVAATMGRPAPDPWRRCLAIIVDGLSACRPVARRWRRWRMRPLAKLSKVC
jgi:hypothetical protein